MKCPLNVLVLIFAEILERLMSVEKTYTAKLILGIACEDGPFPV